MGSLSKDCPCCHRHLEEYLSELPQDKWVSVDGPLDGWEANTILSRRNCINVWNRVVYEHNLVSSVKLRYLDKDMRFVDGL